LEETSSPQQTVWITSPVSGKHQLRSMVNVKTIKDPVTLIGVGGKDNLSATF